MANSTSNSSMSLINLDVDTSASDLKNFLTSQDIFKNYDFTGTALSTLIQLLATNQFKTNFYLNMVFAEMFIDSAQIRASLMSNVKDLNYLPSNYQSASANVNLMVDTNGQLNVLVIPKGTTFSGRVGTKSFIFSTDSTTILSSSNGYFQANNLTIYEGTYFTDSYIVDYTQQNQKYKITNSNVDLTSISVSVTEDSGSSVFEYTQFTSLLDVTPTTLAFFIQPGDGESYEIIFGNGILGRAPKDNAIIQINYRNAQGTVANGVRTFFLSKDVTVGNNNVSYMVNNFTTTNQSAIGGANPESLDSIRFNAPRFFQTQERAVGETDYETLLQQNFPEIIACSAFGGETLNPPQYGTVVISVVLSGIDGLPDSKKQAYLSFLNDGRCVKGIIPQFTTPTDVYVDITSTVKYNVNSTTLQASDITSIIISAIAAYNTANLDNFKVTLYKTVLENVINQAQASIIANDTDLLVYLKLFPSLGVSNNYYMSYNMALDQTKPQMPTTYSTNVVTTISSSPFIMAGNIVELADDGIGNIRLINQSGNNYSVIKNIGTVDYTSGTIQLQSLKIDSYNTDAIRIYAQTASADISVSGNFVMNIEAQGISITSTPVLI